MIDKHAQNGNPEAFKLPEPQIPDLNFSFSGLKTAILYLVQGELKKDPRFLEERMDDLCASVQRRIVSILLNKLKKAAKETGVKEIAIAGGVSANSGLRKGLLEMGEKYGWKVFIPKFEYCTDNAAMIAIAGYQKFLKKDFVGQDIAPLARMNV